MHSVQIFEQSVSQSSEILQSVRTRGVTDQRLWDGSESLPAPLPTWLCLEWTSRTWWRSLKPPSITGKQQQQPNHNKIQLLLWSPMLLKCRGMGRPTELSRVLVLHLSLLLPELEKWGYHRVSQAHLPATGGQMEGGRKRCRVHGKQGMLSKHFISWCACPVCGLDPGIPKQSRLGAAAISSQVGSWRQILKLRFKA